jgi:competence protein ComEA
LKFFLVCFALATTVVGSASAQMPAVPSVNSAKAAADKASAKATAETSSAKTAADSTRTKATDDTSAAKTEVAGKAKAAGAAAKNLLDLNAAAEADIAALPGVGSDQAKKIVEARPFARKDELVSKKILTKDNYLKIKDLVVAKRPATK